ncbi:MAG: YcgN family cysteine cluster protein [Gammaproteobacteria bacterium]|nr:MAG: YcgN family cysteine cluster protein [Gammaproteobacteria bacterium]RLA12811.1 MAG: YcgN family cysteine cluster protein [Gammaproteobacteria bacterium]
MTSLPFWEKPLSELTTEQWEALCDGCARCCQIKLEDENTGARYITNIVCELLDQEQCRCTDYAQRAIKVPDCIVLTVKNSSSLDWMPGTCAYRLRANGEPLPDWHPLISGDSQSVHDAGISVRGKVISEAEVDEDEFEEYVIGKMDPALGGEAIAVDVIEEGRGEAELSDEDDHD